MEIQDIPYQVERVVPGMRYGDQRRAMVAEQVAARGLTNPEILRAMEIVPREQFVSTSLQEMAYLDQPLPIGHGQTISQPYIVAFMAEAAQLQPTDHVLEIGTGSGYGAAVLGQLCGAVDTVEIDPDLAARARGVLQAMGMRNVTSWVGDGAKGWSYAAPYDAIIVTAASDHVPAPLLEQLRVGGRLIIPIEENGVQRLVRISKTTGGFVREELIPVQFVSFRTTGVL